MNGRRAKQIRKALDFDPRENRPYQGKISKVVRYVNKDGTPVTEADPQDKSKVRQKTSFSVILIAGPKRLEYQKLKKWIKKLPAKLRTRGVNDYVRANTPR